MSDPRAVIYDVSGTFYMHFHASAGESLSTARERTIRDVRRAAEGAQYIALALDVRGKTFRHELSGDYKAKREERPQALFDELRKTEEELARTYHAFSCEGYEADDVCATMCAWLLDAIPEAHVHVYSADKDLLALVGDGVTVTSTKTGTEYDAEAVQEKLGVTPCQVEHLLAIAGDTADNIPGVKGVGKTLAGALLKEFGYVPKLIEAAKHNVSAIGAIPKMGPAKVDALLTAVRDGSLELSLKLTTLRKDVPIDCERILTRKEVEPTRKRTENPFPSTPEPEVPMPESTKPSERAPIVVDAEPVSSSQTPAAMVIRPAEWNGALEPRDLKSAFTLAQMVVESRLFEAYGGTPEAALMTIMAGREMGLGAMASLRTFHVVEGKPTMSAQLMMAICIASPLCKEFRVLRSQCSKTRGVVRVWRHDWSEPEEYTWTEEDAADAGLTGKNNWKRYARQMLINRAIAEAARFVFPELMANVYTPSEINPEHMATELAA